EFFGYYCQKGFYKLTPQRAIEVNAIPFPSGSNKMKKMQQFLGSAVFFKPFVYDYAKKTAALTEMTHKDFDWTPSAWTKDYVSVFESFKEDIAHSFTLYHPSYNLQWFLYVDASEVAVGGVLIQVTKEGMQQVIAFVSKKFTTSSA
ncbi:MAG: ribonuclease H family protein, partial [bacterium]